MNDERTTKIIHLARPEGKRGIGRPMMRYDEMGGWCGSRQRKNSSKEMEERG
jgi:hypothetical protein